jgi:ornithine cyclodeaminase
MNASAITAIRTAAVSGVATDQLSRKDSEELAILGAGVQARSHLSAMLAVRTIKRIRVAARHFESARKFAEEMRQRCEATEIIAMENAREAVENADIIVTATNSATPVISREWIKPGTHLNAVGACFPKTRELDSDTVASARFIVDSRESAQNESGDFLIAMAEGKIGPDHILAELGELLTDESKTGRTSAEDITIFKSLGLAVEDLAAASFLLEKAKRQQAGKWIDFD